MADDEEQQSPSGDSGVEQQQPEPPPPEEKKKKKKKKAKPKASKADIKKYEFTDEQEMEVIDFIRDHPVLFDRSHRHFSHNDLKWDLWRKIASRYPDCDAKQVKKFYDNKRSDYVKLDKKLSVSGAAASTFIQRTLQERWSFLEGHICHDNTIVNVTDESELSAHSI